MGAQKAAKAKAARDAAKKQKAFEVDAEIASVEHKADQAVEMQKQITEQVKDGNPPAPDGKRQKWAALKSKSTKMMLGAVTMMSPRDGPTPIQKMNALAGQKKAVKFADAPAQTAAAQKELYGKLNQIEASLEKVLAAQQLASVTAPVNPHTAGVAQAQVSATAINPPQQTAPSWFSKQSPAPEGALEIVDPSGLNARERARLEFGEEMLRTLGLGPEGPNPVHLKVASKLPANHNAGNTFRNDFSFDPAPRTLFVRKDRVQHADELASVITHAASRIKVNAQDLSNDAEPAFMTELHRSVGLLSRELFAKRMGDQKDDAVQKFLEPAASKPSSVTKSSSQPTDFFDAANLHQRLEKYGLMASSQDELNRAFSTLGGHDDENDDVFDLEDDLVDQNNDQFSSMLQHQIEEAENDSQQAQEAFKAAEVLVKKKEQQYRKAGNDEGASSKAKKDLEKAKAELQRAAVERDTKKNRLVNWQAKLDDSNN